MPPESINGLWSRLKALFHPRRPDRDLDAELRFHLDQRAADLIAQGLEPTEARRQARIEFGGVERVKEECRESRGTHFLESALLDIRHGIRNLRKSPGFTVIAILTLALATGVSTAIFGVMYSVLLRPLPYRDQGRIVVAWKGNPQSVSTVGELSYPEFEDWSRQSKSFQSMAAMPTSVYGYALTLIGHGRPRDVETARVSSSFFSVLDVQPKLGRTFSVSDDAPRAAPTVVLSDAFWRSQFQANPRILGKTIDLSGVGYTVIGVMPQRCTFPAGAALWAPLGLMPRKLLQNPGAAFLQVIGRLRPGVSIEKAKAELNGIIRREVVDHPETASTGRFAVLTPLPEIVFGKTRPVVYLLWAASLLLLAIGCLNVASLLVARLLARTREVAVRVAFGATRGNLFRQFTAEGLALALPVALLSIAVARVALVGMVHIAPRGFYGASSAGLDMAAFAFAGTMSLLIAVMFGAVPAMAFAGREPDRFLRAGREPPAAFGRRFHLRNLILAAEIFVATTVLVGAALVVHSYYNLQNVELGFNPRHVLTAEIRLSGEKWQSSAAQHAFFRQFLRRLEKSPEVASAGAILLRPLEGRIGWDAHYAFGGQDAEAAIRNPMANLEVVTPDYFRAVGTPLLAGRYFLPSDTDSGPGVVIVNERLSEARFGSASGAIGKRIRVGLPEDGGPWSRIVGVVGNAHYRGLGTNERDIFLPYLQTAIPLRYVVVRANGNAASLIPILRSEVKRIDESQAIAHLRTMPQMVRSGQERERFSMLLFLFFGITAAVLASIGVYGIVSESVAHRRREIGIRMALGAQQAEVLRKVIREGMKLVGAGILAGICVALAVTRFLRSLLFGMTPWDPATFAAVAFLLGMAALAACYIPARRASRSDPAVALRQE